MSRTIGYALHLFNEKAQELEESRLLESMRAGKGDYTIQWSAEEGFHVDHDLPHIEEIKAYVLTFRLFLVQSEDFSFKQLRARYKKLPVSHSVRTGALDLLDRIDGYLRGDSHLVMEKEVVARSRVLDVALYGGLAHAKDPEKKSVREKWAAHPALAVLMWTEFIEILLAITGYIRAVSAVNSQALAEIHARPGR